MIIVIVTVIALLYKSNQAKNQNQLAEPVKSAKLAKPVKSVKKVSRTEPKLDLDLKCFFLPVGRLELVELSFEF
jgi:hypothetical protein